MYLGLKFVSVKVVEYPKIGPGKVVMMDSVMR